MILLFLKKLTVNPMKKNKHINKRCHLYVAQNKIFDLFLLLWGFYVPLLFLFSQDIESIVYELQRLIFGAVFKCAHNYRGGKELWEETLAMYYLKV